MTDPWFDGGLSPGSEAARAICNEVSDHLSKGRRRQRKSHDLVRLSEVEAAVVSNLMYHHLNGSRGEGISVPRSKRELGRKGTRYQPFVFPASFPKLLNELCALKFAAQKLGVYSGLAAQSKRTTIRAGSKLIEAMKQRQIAFADIASGNADEVIILKRSKKGHWDSGGRMNYEDNAVTNGYRREVQAINSWLAQADIQFDTTTYKGPVVNVRARRLYRSFTMGRFDSGGRLFGGFWESLSKENRLRGLRIEGQRVEGFDYSQLNPSLVYSIAKTKPFEGDAYNLPGLENHRDGVKTIFNAMLFGQVRKFPVGVNSLFPKGTKVGDVTKALLDRHARVKGVLLRGNVGHHLQFIESQIIMDVLRTCKEASIIALPVFDCVVAKLSVADRVETIMQRAFNTATGHPVKVHKEGGLARLVLLSAL